MARTRCSSRALRLLGLALPLASIPALARAGCFPASIPDGSYIGVGDGNDGTGADAGMICCDYIQEVGVPGTVTDVDVTLSIVHSFIGDLTVKLKSPSGTVSTILSRPGYAEPADDGGGDSGSFANWDGSSVLFDEQSSGPSAENLGSGLGNEERVCLDDGVCAYKPDAGSGPGAGLHVDFDGEPYLGAWSLCVGDSFNTDFGSWQNGELVLNLFRPIQCVCFGKFRGGDRVIYAPIVGPTGAGPDANGGENLLRGGGPAPGSTGEVMCGSDTFDQIAVRWDGFLGGHGGNDNCECPTGDIAGTSSYFVACDDLALDLPFLDDFETGNPYHWSFATLPPD